MRINKLIRENHNRKTINLIHLHFFFLSISNIRRLDTKEGGKKKHDDKGATCIQSATNLTDPSRYKYSSNQREGYPWRREDIPFENN